MQITEKHGELLNLSLRTVCSYFDSEDVDNDQDGFAPEIKMHVDVDEACAKLVTSYQAWNLVSKCSEEEIISLRDCGESEDGHAKGLLGAVLALLNNFLKLPYHHQVLAAGLADKIGVRLVQLLLAIPSATLPSSSSLQVS